MRKYRNEYDINAQLDLGDMAEEDTKRLLKLLGRGLIEVKLDAQAQETGNLYIEFEHSPGATGTYVPSGVSVCTGDYVAYRLANGNIIFMDLLWLLAQQATCRTVSQPNGSCPTHGFLLPLSRLAGLGL